MVRGRISSRAADECLLSMLRARARREPLADIAAAHEVSPSDISTITNRIRLSDLDESGEPADLVSAAYWPVRGRR